MARHEHQFLPFRIFDKGVTVNTCTCGAISVTRQPGLDLPFEVSDPKPIVTTDTKRRYRITNTKKTLIAGIELRPVEGREGLVSFAR